MGLLSYSPVTRPAIRATMTNRQRDGSTHRLWRLQIVRFVHFALLTLFACGTVVSSIAVVAIRLVLSWVRIHKVRVFYLICPTN